MLRTFATIHVTGFNINLLLKLLSYLFLKTHTKKIKLLKSSTSTHLEFVVNHYQYNIFQLYKYEITSQTAEVTN